MFWGADMFEQIAEPPLRDLVLAAAGDALENMFFTGILGLAEDASFDDAAIRASVDFSGTASGKAILELSRSSAVDLAASFLGQDSDAVSMQDAESVVLELANIVCGSALSHWCHDGLFTLSTPVLLGERVEYAGATRVTLELESGFLAISMSMQTRGGEPKHWNERFES